MTSLLTLALILFLAWVWSVWQRERGASFMREWSYVLLVGSVTCAVMGAALGMR